VSGLISVCSPGLFEIGEMGRGKSLYAVCLWLFFPPASVDKANRLCLNGILSQGDSLNGGALVQEQRVVECDDFVTEEQNFGFVCAHADTASLC
jgi:hypothetical protein